MRHFRHILFALVAFLWLPVSVHCLVTCVCSDVISSRNCQCPVCQTLWSGGYEAKGIQSSVTALVGHSFAPMGGIFGKDLLLARSLNPTRLTGSLLALSKSWQFDFRVASPPRAPSLQIEQGSPWQLAAANAI
jgi:hypothetical protein